jgi:hypothetical protein
MISKINSNSAKRRIYHAREVLEKIRMPGMLTALLLFIFLFLTPLRAQTGEQQFYTLQTGIFPEFSSAMKQFNKIMEGASKGKLEDLRIENIDKYYAVRLGRFMDRVSAEEFLRGDRSLLSGAIILKAHIRKINIMTRYRKALAVENAVTSDEPLPPAEPVGKEEAQVQQESVYANKRDVPSMRKGVVYGEDKKAQAEEKKYYTVQLGSYSEINNAMERFSTIIQGASKAELEDLRIEKIGKFYAVRLGRFEGYTAAKVYLRANSPQLTGAVILQAYVREKNIVKRYGESLVFKDAVTTEDHLSPVEPAEAEEVPVLQVPEYADKPEVPAMEQELVKAADKADRAEEQQFYTLQTGSFPNVSTALEQFNTISQGASKEELEYLRIEKIGEFYAVRLGKFAGYTAAVESLRANSPLLSGAIILEAFIRGKNIVKRYGDASAVEDAVTTEELLAPAKPSYEEEAPVPQEPDYAGEPEVPAIEMAVEDTATTEEPLPPFEPAGAEDVPVPQEPAIAPEPEVPAVGLIIAKEKDEKEQPKELPLSQKPEPEDDRKFYSNMRGRFSISDYYSVDSSNNKTHSLTSRVNLSKQEEEDAAGFSFKLDARGRTKIDDGEIRGSDHKIDFNEVWIAYKFFPEEKFKISAGRQYIYELYNTIVDGLDVKYSFKKGIGVGIFGGNAPDKFTYDFSSKFTSLGGYTFYTTDKYKVQFGYENLAYEGATDREYFSFKLFSTLDEKTRFNVISATSINQVTNSFEVENVNMNLLYAHTKNLRFNLYYNFYNTIRFFESSKIFFDRIDLDENFFLSNNSQTRVGLRGDYKITKKLKIYGSTVYQVRELDDKDALRLTAGIRRRDLYGFDFSGRYTHVNNFSSVSDEFNVEVARYLFDKVDVSVYASHEEEKLELENSFTAGLLTYGASIYWQINRNYYLSMFLEKYDEEEFHNTSVYVQGGYSFR